MNESSENKEATTTSQPPRYSNLVHHAKAPAKKRLARSRSPSPVNTASKKAAAPVAPGFATPVRAAPPAAIPAPPPEPNRRLSISAATAPAAPGVATPALTALPPRTARFPTGAHLVAIADIRRREEDLMRVLRIRAGLPEIPDAVPGRIDFGAHRFFQDPIAPAAPAPSRGAFVTMSREEENAFARYLDLKAQGHVVMPPERDT